MHSRFRAKGVILAALVALTALLALPGTLVAKPQPGVTGRGFRLHARAIGAMTINRIYCGIAATGEICVDSTNSSTIGGGYWPKGSPQQYVFNSGLQAAGAIDPAAGFAWAGDTTGAFFFDPKGTTQHGQLVQPIYNYSDPNDKAHWPAAANVPQGDPSADVFDANLQGLPSASQGDVWTMAWDGDPSLIAGRPHPLGIAVETRGLGWNYPVGNNDIIYFIYTFYNVTSTCAADYANVRPAMQSILLGLGQQFQALNNAAFGITIPTCGYAINDFYADFAADMDVSSDAGSNFSSVNLPFSLGYVYEATFRAPEGGSGAKLPQDIVGAPFTGGYGFVGVKYLKSPVVNGNEVGIKLFSNTINGGTQFGDPQNVQQLYRYLSGTVNPALGDGLCNFDPVVDRVCYVKNDAPADMRFYQSSGPFNLPPGGQGSIVVGYIFASPVAVPGCTTAGCGGSNVPPGDPRFLTDGPFLATTGANLVDSLSGFAGYNDNNADGIVQQDEFTTVKGSLLAKAIVAQTVFDSRFLLPSAPNAPEFFLVPGDNQVAIFWRKSTTETAGDIFYPAAANPGTPASPNLLYDPNYRQFDVEGYRIYRGRVDNPSALTLLAQFDYPNTTFSDYLGVVNPTPGCAPELGVQDDCPVTFDTPGPGVAYSAHEDYNIGGIGLDATPFIQVRTGGRLLLSDGTAWVIAADTAVTGDESDGFQPLKGNDVPFTYVDKTAKNNLRYFYAVTAFDVNSIVSGPSSLESARITKSVIPVHPASNYDNDGTVSIGIFGRGVNMTEVIPKTPAINSSTGIFSGPARPATAASMGFVGDFVKQVVTVSGEFSLTLNSMEVGSAYDGEPNVYHFTATTPAGSTPLDLSVVQNVDNTPVNLAGSLDGGPINNNRAQRYGGSNAYHLAASWALTYPGAYYTTSYGRGCVNGATGFTSRCQYNGARWFDGPTPTANETFPNPTRDNGVNGFGGGTAVLTTYQNAGQVSAGTGNVIVYEPRSYQGQDNVWRNIEGVGGGVATAADYNVYWGAGGTVDSVVDYTHNVLVPFATDATGGYTWGWLTQANANNTTSYDARTELTVADFGCLEPYRSYGSVQGVIPCGGAAYPLSQTAALGPISLFSGAYAGGHPVAALTSPVAAGPGVGMYIAGHMFMFEFPAGSTNGDLPAAGSVWTLRTYTGAVRGGQGGGAGNQGAYSFYEVKSPLTAVGASVKAAYTVSNRVVAATEADLDRVHTVPDPYYVTNGYEVSPTNKVIKFVNLPQKAIVRIYSTSGVLVRVLEHNSNTFGGTLDWDVRNRNNQIVASGVYFYAIEASDARRVGRMTIVNFAQ